MRVLVAQSAQRGAGCWRQPTRDFQIVHHNVVAAPERGGDAKAPMKGIQDHIAVAVLVVVLARTDKGEVGVAQVLVHGSAATIAAHLGAIGG